jgi:hypothetical protein
VYETHEEEQEEPPYQYVPDLPHMTAVTDRADALAESMLLLADGLASGALVAQFEQLYRKKPGLSTDEAKKNENQSKNRYRDISPCTCFIQQLFHMQYTRPSLYRGIGCIASMILSLGMLSTQNVSTLL